MKKALNYVSVVLVASALLTGCGSSKWQVKVDLAPDKIQAIQAEIQKEKEAIKNFKPSEGSVYPDLDVLTLGNDYEKLGDLKSAADTYKEWLDKGYKSKSLNNNLAHIYDEVGEVDLAVQQYQILVDQYLDNAYYYDITWVYLHAAQKSTGSQELEYRKKAEKYFNAWQLAVRQTDNATQDAIKELRAKEAATNTK
jgi:tetratricopeptide (TPR) repeat protein